MDKVLLSKFSEYSCLVTHMNCRYIPEKTMYDTKDKYKQK